ncbi:MAG: pyridoxamine 5'-phosphate oxidase family protein [Gammaproteobacteria bacterium]|nr:pyridoxamine 5'-phosphate oxidase family protein [Gammaproteobacteria bacterium]
MGKQYSALSDELANFIKQQKIFFVATAPHAGRVNVSPKGMDSLRVVDRTTVAWLNVTGSGNETAAHVLENRRMTIMFCAFESKPVILRLYGQAQTYHARDPEWDHWLAQFEPIPGARQIFVLSIELVQTSCGFGVPLFSYDGERELLRHWAEKKGSDGLLQYWREKNQVSLDGLKTAVIEPSK